MMHVFSVQALQVVEYTTCLPRLYNSRIRPPASTIIAAMEPTRTITPELGLHLHLMMRYRRWGEKLIFIPIIIGIVYVIMSMRGISLLKMMETPLGLVLVNGALLILWPVLLFGIFAVWQIYRTALLAFGVPRALGYLILASVFALLPAYFFFQYMPLLYGSILAFPLWFGVFIVPSLLKEEVRRRFDAGELKPVESLTQ